MGTYAIIIMMIIMYCGLLICLYSTSNCSEYFYTYILFTVWCPYNKVFTIFGNCLPQVSIDEWNSMWNDYALNPSAALKWQQQYCHFMFELEDTSADGSIDCDEFTTVCSSYGIDPPECKAAFAKMAKVCQTSNNMVKIILILLV